MRLLFILIAHLLVTLARLTRPGGVRAVAAESLAVKHQLLIMKRSQRRSPNLTAWDRVILGFCTLLVSPRRLGKISVILKTSTLLRLHRALVKRKYRLLYSSRRCGRPGPKAPSRDLIDAVVEMNGATHTSAAARSANLGCLRRRAQQGCRPAHPYPLLSTGT
jgi:hypothetical protein